MPRAKKKALPSDAHQQDTSFNPSEFDKPAEIVQSVADGMAMPQDAQPAPEPTHAERYKREPHYSNQGRTDYVVGARLLEHRNPYKSIIRFNEPVSEKLERFLAGCGFEKNTDVPGHSHGEFHRPIHYATAREDRDDAERVFLKACKALRQERGIGHDYGHAARVEHEREHQGGREVG